MTYTTQQFDDCTDRQLQTAFELMMLLERHGKLNTVSVMPTDVFTIGVLLPYIIFKFGPETPNIYVSIGLNDILISERPHDGDIGSAPVVIQRVLTASDAVPVIVRFLIYGGTGKS